MTANRTQNAALDQQLILELRIDASGEVTRKPTKLGAEGYARGKAPRLSSILASESRASACHMS